MKIVFDTNVIISSFLFPGFSTKVYNFCIKNYTVITSDWLIEELEEKLIDKFKIQEETIEEIISLLKHKISCIRPLNSLPNICRDEDDNHVLQISEYILADFIITGDKDLLILEQFNQTKIVSPRDFYNTFIID